MIPIADLANHQDPCDPCIEVCARPAVRRSPQLLRIVSPAPSLASASLFVSGSQVNFDDQRRVVVLT